MSLETGGVGGVWGWVINQRITKTKTFYSMFFLLFTAVHCCSLLCTVVITGAHGRPPATGDHKGYVVFKSWYRQLQLLAFPLHVLALCLRRCNLPSLCCAS